MRNAADAYRQSDPDFNRNFRRGYRWSEMARPARPMVIPPKSLDQLAAEVAHFWRAETGRA
ncbi:hypothetical protein [Roseomonas genomospecies 6]|uniref:Uncharacterized protein n=1 Tax=Roseomonas genomospecies 6 TaxID=214106 RepID=A0A9W7TYQ9_9PROT|nr:hypothetical protein [Roseomonas genomospecies 6]KAA0680285.1 hypothetical protein DS843_13280 [Roseomonas genomospecies 6]